MELLVVSVVMWFVVDYLYTRTATYLERGASTSAIATLSKWESLPIRVPIISRNQTDEQEDADILELVDRLRRRPEIEAVSLSQKLISI